MSTKPTKPAADPDAGVKLAMPAAADIARLAVEVEGLAELLDQLDALGFVIVMRAA